MKKAVFAGSFDPISIAHVNIIKRARLMVDELVVLVAHNDEKKQMFTNYQKIKMIESVIKDMDNVSVEAISGLVVDYCLEKGINYQIRAIRNSNDLIYEQDLFYNNRHISEGIETIFLLSEQQYFHVSSSRIRELIFFNKSFAHMVSKEVYEYIKLGKV